MTPHRLVHFAAFGLTIAHAPVSAGEPSASAGEAATTAPLAVKLPLTMKACGEACFSLSWEGGQYRVTGGQSRAASATITVESFTRDAVVMSRTDEPDDWYVTGRKFRYVGKIASDGNHLVGTETNLSGGKGVTVAFRAVWGAAEAEPLQPTATVSSSPAPGSSPPPALGPRPAPAGTTTHPAPDVLGVRPGMPLADAKALLQAYNPKLPFWPMNDPGFVAQVDGEGFTVAATYSQPQLVSLIMRELTACSLRTDLLANLGKKYGSESTETAGGLVWSFDDQGRPIPKSCHVEPGVCKAPRLVVAAKLRGPGAPNCTDPSLSSGFSLTIVDQALRDRTLSEALRGEADARWQRAHQGVEQAKRSKVPRL